MLFLILTFKICRSFIDFQVWDFPGQIDYFDTATYDSDVIFGEYGALIFVIDAQVSSPCDYKIINQM